MARTYALSDIHGCLNKLEGLVARCRADGGDSAKFVFLGDYIDRGPDSRGVLEYVIGLQRRMPGQVDLPLRQPRGPGAQRDRRSRRDRPVGGLQRRRQGAAQLRRDAPVRGPRRSCRMASRAGDAPRRRAALLRSRRHRSRPAAGPAGAARSALDAGAVPVRSARSRPLHRPRPHAAAGRPARPAGQPGEHRYRRRAGRPADRGGVRRQQAGDRSGSCRNA